MRDCPIEGCVGPEHHEGPHWPMHVIACDACPPGVVWAIPGSWRPTPEQEVVLQNAIAAFEAASTEAVEGIRRLVLEDL